MGFFAFLFRALFVGHSLVDPNLPVMVEEALRRMDGPAAVEAQIINGAPLSYNWDHAAEAEGVNGRARLALGATDVLILTEAQPVGLHAQHSDSAAQVARWAALAAKANPAVRVFLYETWPSLDSGPGQPVKDDPERNLPWAERIARDRTIWESIAAEASARGVPVQVIPAGQAMLALSAEISAGGVPGITDLRQLFEDDVHPNGKGLYFIAMVHAAAITGRSPEGLPAKLTRSWPSRDAAITDEQATVFQRVAWRVVSTYRPEVAAPAAAAEPQAEPAPPPPAAPVIPVAGFAPITNPNLALGLAGVNDWSVQQPFLDLMKTARPWVGHLPGQWGGWGHDELAAGGWLDDRGWPKAIPPELEAISTLILTDLPEDAGGLAGRYALTWEGDGTLRVEGRAQVVSATPGRILFDYAPGEGAVLLTIAATDPADPIRNITAVREDRQAALAAGQIFNPDWLARIRGAKMVRFMDWGMTNDSPLATSAQRAKPADYTWARVGVPVEVMVALANEIQADAWFTLPHLADDALVEEWAKLAHEGLAPGLRAWVEYSNEVWNWQFAQARWAEEQGRARWGQENTWVQFYALRAAEVAGIWTRAFADAPDRLVRVVTVQTGWLGLEADILKAPLVMAEGRPAPAESFDAYAVTGYFSARLGAEDKMATLKDWLAQSLGADPAAPFALANRLAAQELRDGSVTGDPSDTLAQLLSETLPYHAAVAADTGLRLVMYEGGTHVVGQGAAMEDAALTEFFAQLNYSPEMGQLYAELLAGWSLVSDAPFNAFVDVYRPGKWGSWGALRHLGDDNPRWRALATGCDGC